MTPLTETAVEVAEGAAEILREAYGRATSVSAKGPIDLVTEADMASERFILDELKRRHPDHDVVAEESGTRQQGGAVRWIVDPLDGTVNFAHRVPHFSVLIAAQQRRGDGWETVTGVVSDPMRRETFVAELGAGATLNGAPIRVSTARRLIDALLCTGFPYDRLFSTDDNHREFCRMNLISRGVRRFGSAGLDFAYVACGRFDGFWERGLNPWDVAAGALLVSEAGATLTAADGGPFALEQGSVCAANPALHPALLDALRAAAGVPANSRDGIDAYLPDELARRLRQPPAPRG